MLENSAIFNFTFREFNYKYIFIYTYNIFKYKNREFNNVFLC